MCGIAAIVSHGRPVEPGALDAAIAAMHHRGPDGRGRWVSDRRDVGLAHARLAIVDAEGGAQPIANETGRIRAVVNGELYGHDRLRRALESAGHAFRTRSDSEVLLHLYEQHGEDFWRHLRGEFAFALWDDDTRTLLVGRDRFGVKPACWAAHDGRVLVASEAKALFAMGLPARWDHESFFQAASHQYVLPDRSVFQGVHTIPPGHVLRVSEGRARIERWWDLDLPRDEEREPITPADATARVRTALDEAVRLRLSADVPVAFQLSGGVDSSAVLGCAAQHERRTLDAFTVSFDDPATDESAIAARTAASLGARLHVVRATPDALVAALPEAVRLSEGLAINAHLPAKWLLSRAIRDAGYKVVLSGEGSDELFLGYPHLRRDLLRATGEGDDLDATNGVSAGVQLPRGDGLSLAAVQHTLGFTPTFLAAKATFGLRLHALLAPDFREPFAVRDPYAHLLSQFDLGGQLRGRARIEQSAYLWTKTALATSILRTLGDGTELAHSVEGRVPFLDHELFAVARSLPVGLRVRDGIEKWVLREAVRPWVTDEVLRREKHPFMGPALAPAPQLRALVEELLSAPQPFFDPAAVRAAFDRLPSLDRADRTAWDAPLLFVTTALLLQRAFSLAG